MSPSDRVTQNINSALDQSGLERVQRRLRDRQKLVQAQSLVITIEGVDSTGLYYGVTALGDRVSAKYIGNTPVAIGDVIAVVLPLGSKIGWADQKVR
jgi:hypothetical protein